MNENDDYCRLTPVSDTEPLSLPIEPMFQLTMEEAQNFISQITTSN